MTLLFCPEPVRILWRLWLYCLKPTAYIILAVWPANNHWQEDVQLSGRVAACVHWEPEECSLEEESIIGGHLIAECVFCVSGWSFSEKSTMSDTANKRNNWKCSSKLFIAVSCWLITTYISTGRSNRGKYWCIKKCKFIAHDMISRKADGRLTAMFADGIVSVALFRQLILILVSGVKVVDSTI